MRDVLLQFFEYSHLPDHLQEHSRPFCDLAKLIVETLPSNPERTTALRKLLEAKDCAVRARLFKPAAMPRGDQSIFTIGQLAALGGVDK